MTKIRRLIRELHRRSLWQVLRIYLAASWVQEGGHDALALIGDAGAPG